MIINLKIFVIKWIINSKWNDKTNDKFIKKNLINLISNQKNK